jgi:hypothetical protein
MYCIWRLLLKEEQSMHKTSSLRFSPRIVKMVGLEHILHHPGIKALPVILTAFRSSFSKILFNLDAFLISSTYTSSFSVGKPDSQAQNKNQDTFLVIQTTQVN